MPRAEPGRRGRGARAEVHPDAAFVQQVEHLVEEGEVPDARGGVDRGPAEDVDRDEADADLAHEGDILAPHRGVPLFGVVVAPEQQTVLGEDGQGGGCYGVGHAGIAPLGCVHVHTLTPPRRSTVHDVARAAGVSRGTVSRVLNGGYVSGAARAAIEKAIRDVGYVPNTAARNLVRQRTQAIGFIVHEPHSLFVEDPNIGGILLGTNTALSEADYQMVCIIVDTARDADRVARYLSGGFVDGVVVVSAREHDPITAVVRRLGLPAAYVGHPPDISGAWVGIDNRGAARAVTERLRETGRRRIGMIAAALDRDSGADRLEGFRDALGDSFDPDLVERVPLYAFSDGAAGMRRLLERPPRPRRRVRGLRRGRRGSHAGPPCRRTPCAGRRRDRGLRRQCLGAAHRAAAVDGAPARRGVGRGGGVGGARSARRRRVGAQGDHARRADRLAGIGLTVRARLRRWRGGAHPSPSGPSRRRCTGSASPGRARRARPSRRSCPGRRGDGPRSPG